MNDTKKAEGKGLEWAELHAEWNDAEVRIAARGYKVGFAAGRKQALEWVLNKSQIQIECLDDPQEFEWLRDEIKKELEKA